MGNWVEWIVRKEKDSLEFKKRKKNCEKRLINLNRKNVGFDLCFGCNWNTLYGGLFSNLPPIVYIVGFFFVYPHICHGQHKKVAKYVYLENLGVSWRKLPPKQEQT